jgi:hypothetical protein
MFSLTLFHRLQRVLVAGSGRAQAEALLRERGSPAAAAKPADASGQRSRGRLDASASGPARAHPWWDPGVAAGNRGRRPGVQQGHPLERGGSGRAAAATSRRPDRGNPGRRGHRPNTGASRRVSSGSGRERCRGAGAAIGPRSGSGGPGAESRSEGRERASWSASARRDAARRPDGRKEAPMRRAEGGAGGGAKRRVTGGRQGPTVRAAPRAPREAGGYGGRSGGTERFGAKDRRAERRSGAPGAGSTREPEAREPTPRSPKGRSQDRPGRTEMAGSEGNEPHGREWSKHTTGLEEDQAVRAVGNGGGGATRGWKPAARQRRSAAERSAAGGRCRDTDSSGWERRRGEESQGSRVGQKGRRSAPNRKEDPGSRRGPRGRAQGQER